MNTNYTLNLQHVMSGTLMNKVSGSSTLRPLPDFVGRFQLKEVLGRSPHFMHAIYESAEGEKAFAKHWSGRVKNLHYYSLLSEMFTADFLWKKRRSTFIQTPRKLSHVDIPRVLGSLETPTSFTLLTEYVKGDPISTLPTPQRISMHRKTIDYLRFLGESMSGREKSKLAQRTGWSEVVTYPIVLVMACIAHPALTTLFLQASIIFLKNVGELIRSPKLVLTHRDLHDENVLVKKDHITIIDFEYTSFSLPEYEFISTLLESWSNEEFRRALLSDLMKLNSNVARALTVKVATNYLTDRSVKFEKKNWYIECLQQLVQKRILI